MGIVGTLLGALGLQRPVRVREPGPPQLGRGGRVRLEQLPAEHGVVVRAVPVEGGFMAEIVEEAPGPDHVEVNEGLFVSPTDAEHLAGLELDHDGRGWKASVALHLGTRETPNPDGRLFEVDRVLHRGRPAFYLGDTPAQPRLVRKLLDHDGVQSVLLRAHTLTVERRGATSWARIDRHVEAVLREHFLLCGPVIDGDRQLLDRDPLEAEVAQVLEDEVLPGVHRDGGDIVLLRVRDGVAYVSLRGACASCPASVLTLKGSVERVLMRAFPAEIDRVIAE